MNPIKRYHVISNRVIKQWAQNYLHIFGFIFASHLNANLMTCYLLKLSVAKSCQIISGNMNISVGRTHCHSHIMRHMKFRHGFRNVCLSLFDIIRMQCQIYQSLCDGIVCWQYSATSMQHYIQTLIKWNTYVNNTLSMLHKYTNSLDAHKGFSLNSPILLL